MPGQDHDTTGLTNLTFNHFLHRYLFQPTHYEPFSKPHQLTSPDYVNLNIYRTLFWIYYRRVWQMYTGGSIRDGHRHAGTVQLFSFHLCI